LIDQNIRPASAPAKKVRITAPRKAPPIPETIPDDEIPGFKSVHTDTKMQLRQRLFASAADRLLLDSPESASPYSLQAI
jgi:hypothetical protein